MERRAWLYVGLVGLVAALFAGQRSQATPAAEGLAPDITRAILEQLDRQPERARLHFSVPVDVVREISSLQHPETVPAVSDAPVSGLLDRWQAVVTLDENRVDIELSMTATIFRATPTTPFLLPLFPVDEVFSEVRLNDVPVDPVDRDGWWGIAIDEVGSVCITATLKRRVTGVDSAIKLRLDKQPFPVATVAVRSDTLVDLFVDTAGRTVATTMGGGAIQSLPVGMGERLDLTIRPHRERPIRRGTPSISPSFVWTVGERVLTANGHVDVSILGGRRDRVALILPPGADKLRVSGPDVRETRHSGSKLDVFFKRAVSSRTQVVLSFQLPRQSVGAFACPELGVEGGRVGNTGWLLIVNDAGGEILETETKGLAPSSTLDLPERVAGLSPGKPAFIYRRTAARVAARFETVGTSPFPMRETIADRADVVATVRPAGDEMVRIRYRVRNNRRQFLRVCPPSGARLLAASVEEKSCRVSHDGEDWLIPLAKSIQTLGGLVSFPVELVYVRQGEPFVDGRERTCRLPRLEDVPVAIINVKWSCPDGIRLRGYDSALLMAKTFTQTGPDAMTYGYGHARPNEVRPSAPPVTDQDLAGNYYRAGYAAYQQGRLEDAEHFLTNATSLAADAEMLRNSEDLLSNIQEGRGEVDSSLDSAGRAKVAAIKRGLSRENVKLASEQQALISSGLAMIQRGDAELGAELLAEAEEQGGKLKQRSASSAEQQAIAAQYEVVFSEVRGQQEQNKKLRERLSGLQSATRAWTSDAQSVQPQQAAQFNRALAKVADEANLDIEILQEAAFGLNVKDLAQDASQDLDKRIQAKRAGQSHRQAGKGLTLSERNTRLKRQVDAMERVVEVSKKQPGSPNAPLKPQLSAAQYANVRGQVVEVRRKAKSLTRQVAAPASGPQPDVAELIDEKTARKQLGELQAWSVANSFAFAGAGDTLKAEFQQLAEEIEEGEKEVTRQHEAQQQAQTITVNLDNVLSGRGRADQQAFGKFLSANYVGALTNTVGTAEVHDGQIYVGNRWSNADVLNDAISNFSKNHGTVSRVKGANVNVPLLGDIPSLGQLFREQTEEGQRYAILDEAEYRTLLDAGRLAAGPPLGGAAAETERDVIVGSSNIAAGQEFTLATGGADYNDLIVNGTAIGLPHDRYLAIDNGGYVTVIHSSRVRDWQDAAEAPAPLIPEVSRTIEIPQVGIPFFFEKTYLEPGESPDVVLRYTYKGEPT